MARSVMIFLLIVALIIFSIAGCSPENSKPIATEGFTRITVSGQVELPGNSSLPLQKLKIITCIGEKPVAQDGSFSTQEAGAGPALAFAADADGNLLLMGFVSGSATGGNKINAASTAPVLIVDAKQPIFLF